LSRSSEQGKKKEKKSSREFDLIKFRVDLKIDLIRGFRPDLLERALIEVETKESNEIGSGSEHLLEPPIIDDGWNTSLATLMGPNWKITQKAKIVDYSIKMKMDSNVLNKIASFFQKKRKEKVS
jgi:hypothetical protein